MTTATGKFNTEIDSLRDLAIESTLHPLTKELIKTNLLETIRHNVLKTSEK